jgi:hypothetical protein
MAINLAPRLSKAETKGKNRLTANCQTHLTQCAVAQRESVISGLASAKLQHAFCFLVPTILMNLETKAWIRTLSSRITGKNAYHYTPKVETN